ncbi:MAG: ABC transporter ATP-binding protein [Candidatus Bipolaricaulota bacterium]
MKISLRGLHFAYQDREVLSGVDLEVASGEILALLGPNGCGKTTLLRHIAGVLMPSAGTVYLDLDDLGDLGSRELARRLAVVEQDRRTGFDFTAAKLVELGRLPHIGRLTRLRDADRRATARAMKLTGVTGFADRPVSQLSGGERQRVFLAMALAQEPDALLLDEPTAHLDIHHQLEFMHLVRRRAQEGITVVMALHDVNMAAAFADRLAVMKDGAILAAGRPREALTPAILREAFNVHCVVGRSPATGSLYVHFMPSPQPQTKQGRVLVIGGGGAASPLLPALSHRHHVCLGVVAPLDSDYEVARQLGISVIVEAPFSPVTEKPLRKLRDELQRADQVIVAPLWVGPGNMPVLTTVSELANPAKVLVVDPDGLEGRDFTGGEATRVLRNLLGSGAGIASESDIIHPQTL